MSVTQSLRDSLPELPKKLQIAARFALEHPDQVALNSMRSTAGAVGVTSTTMLRLARQLGYESYDDFRAEFQLGLVRGAFGARADALKEGNRSLDSDRSETLMDTVLRAAQRNIETMQFSLSQTELDQAAKAILHAHNVYLIGTGSLFGLASMMKNTGGMVLPNLRLIGTEYVDAREAMGALSGDDVVVGFGINPIAQSTVSALRFAAMHNATVVAITDRPSSPLADRASFVLCAGTDSPHYYPSIAPMMIIVEGLLASVVASGNGDELTRIKEIERIRRQSGSYIEI